MGQTTDNLKHGGAMSRHFGAKAVRGMVGIGGGFPMVIGLSVAAAMGIYADMEDMDTVGADKEGVVYSEITNDIQRLTASFKASESLFAKRADFENLQDNATAQELLGGRVSFAEEIKDLTIELAATNYGFKDELKGVLADIYLSGSAEEGLALSEEQAYELLSQISALEIPADRIPENMGLNRMLLKQDVAEHLDEAVAEVDLSSMTNASLSDRYSMAQKVANGAHSEDFNGGAGFALGALLSFIISIFGVVGVLESSRLERCAREKPKKPVVKSH